jgi:hypothetical protein
MRMKGAILVSVGRRRPRCPTRAHGRTITARVRFAGCALTRQVRRAKLLSLEVVVDGPNWKPARPTQSARPSGTASRLRDLGDNGSLTE